MRRQLTITVSEEVYEGLYRVIGRRHISRFLESLARPHVIAEDMERAYQRMSQDKEREAQALQWADAREVECAIKTPSGL
jgi:predicted CopG family antitoxin